MKKVKLSFGTFNSIPSGLTNEEMERAYQTRYKPFLAILYSFPKIPLVLHYSGSLLEWIEEHHPEFIMLLSEMVSRKQVELLGGGYYDPIFSIIPGSDRIGQIESFTTYLRKHFGRRPRGCWITEGVWEPCLAASIKNSGIDYIYLEEEYFQQAGLQDSDLYTPVITEDQGKSITVFPLTSRISRRIPADSPESILDSILEASSRKNEHLVSLLVPGETFISAAAGGAEEFFNIEWLTRFINLILEQGDKIELFLPVKYFKNVLRTKKVYFDASLITNGSVQGRKTFRQLVNFHPESRNLYSKMIYAHSLVNQMRGDKYRKKAAREEIWKGQNHFPYWGGDRGGIHWNSARKAAYSSLIEAEKLTREKGIFKSSIITTDFDMDGLPEYLFQGEELNAYLHPCGGTVFELDYIPKPWNYLDTFYPINSRESVKTSAPGKKMLYKTGSAFIDHFLSNNLTSGQFHNTDYTELGDFIGKEYTVKSIDKDKKYITFVVQGKINSGSQCYPLEIEKKYQFQSAGIQVSLRLTNLGEKRISCFFGEEVNLSFGGNNPIFYQVFNQVGENKTELTPGQEEYGDATELFIDDKRNHLYLTLQSSIPVNFSFSSKMQDELKEYQGTSFLFRWNLGLERGCVWETSLMLSLSKKRGKKSPSAI